MSEQALVRVLHVLPFDTLAGTELMVASLILRSDPGVVCHELATFQRAGPIAERLRAGGRRAEALAGPAGLVGATWRLARLLRSRPYDVVNAYGLRGSVVARLLVRLVRPRAAFVCGVRGVHVADVERLDSLKGRIAARVERLLSPLVDVYDANSRGALTLLAEIGIDSDRLVYIPNGLDLSMWAPADPGGGDDDAPPTILCAARFAPVKRHSDLLAALAELKRRGHGFRAVLAGEGPTLPEMRSLATRLGLNRQVEFPGRLTTADMHALLDETAVACLASSSEGMPGALMEAMASGVPVVGTDVSGTNELVADGESGLLVAAHDPIALANALAALLDDGELRRRLAAGARRRMEEQFSLDVMLAAKERLYRGLAAGRGRTELGARGAPAAAAHD